MLSILFSDILLNRSSTPLYVRAGSKHPPVFKDGLLFFLKLRSSSYFRSDRELCNPSTQCLFYSLKILPALFFRSLVQWTIYYIVVVMLRRHSLLFPTLFFLVQLAAAVSLSRLQDIPNLPEACATVWDSQIPGCVQNDFANGNACSSNCISGLNSIYPNVQKACNIIGVNNDTLLWDFLHGNGVVVLCPNANPGSDGTTIGDGGDSTTTTETSQTTTPPTVVTDDILSGKTVTLESTPGPALTSILVSPSTLDVLLSSPSVTPTTTLPSTVSSTSNNPQSDATKGFGGSGNSFDILASDGSPSVEHTRTLLAGVTVVTLWVTRMLW